MKNLVTKILTWASKRVLAKHKPIIIAVTGSVGKTSTRDAIALVLGTKFRVRVPKKNLNTEIGVPLVILDLDKPTSAWGWLALMFKAIGQATASDQSYPTHLVLEFGADRPGDIKHLCELAPPSVGVVTAITHVHVANYPSLEAMIAEKAELIKCLPADGLAILNADDERTLAMRQLSKALVVTYGSNDQAEVAVVDYVLNAPRGIRFAVADRRTEEMPTQVELAGTLGAHQALVCAAAIAVGKHFGVSAAQAAKVLSAQYSPPAGRLKPLAGIKQTLLLDDSYNAAPASMNAALEVLKACQPTDVGRRVAALGEMAELGPHTEEQHRQLGWRAAEAGVDLLVLVGEKSRDTARGALEAGMKDDQIVLVKNAEEAGRYLDKEIKSGDVVLIKGSQSSRMEKTVRDLLADPTKASELLVRQEPEWQ